VKPEKQRTRLDRCQRAVEEHPERASAHYNLALAYSRSGRVTLAEASYRNALARDPALVEAWVNLGGLRLAMWDFAGCLEATREAVRLRPDLAAAHFNMGQAHLYLNQPEELLHCCQRVLELEREHAAAHYFAAAACLALGDLGVAERHLGRAMELGYQPTREILQALEKTQRQRAAGGVPLTEITGAVAPDTTDQDKEESDGDVRAR
jgi:tetratricopeptide (TPR) repeat protein